MRTCSWWGSFAPGANFISMVAMPLSRSTTSVFDSTPGNEVLSHGNAATSTKREASGGNCAWARALGVSPLILSLRSLLGVLSDLHDLHCIRAAGLADGLADSEHDEIAGVHHL